LAGSLLLLTNTINLSITSTSLTDTAYGVVLQRFVDALDIVTITDISTLEVTDANFATLERLSHWQAAREMWRDNLWLGVGFGNYAVIYPAYAVGRWLDPLGHAHNYLLNLGAETGLAGIIGYLIFWILALGVSYLAVRRSDGFYRAVAAGGLGVLVHLQIHNLFDNLYVQGMYLTIAIVLALTSIIYVCKRKNSHP
jgi:O-antigen ligase